MSSAKSPVGIAGVACAFPLRRTLAEEAARAESTAFDATLGIAQIPTCDGETASSLALSAARDALQRANAAAAQVDVILDYSILPQEYLVPAWNMSNKLQHELGATRAFTSGFSGGASANFLMALSSATAMLQTDAKLKTALLVAGDTAIPGNRVLRGSSAITILGDAGSAMVLKRDAESAFIVDVDIVTRGENHDVYFIPGGALAHDEPEKYRIVVDGPRYDAALASNHLKEVVELMLNRNGLGIEQISCAILPNTSDSHSARLKTMLRLSDSQVCGCKLRDHGHLQGSDLVLNYLSLTERGAIKPGDYVMFVSDGMGFMSGAALVRF